MKLYNPVTNKHMPSSITTHETSHPKLLPFAHIRLTLWHLMCGVPAPQCDTQNSNIRYRRGISRFPSAALVLIQVSCTSHQAFNTGNKGLLHHS